MKYFLLIFFCLTTLFINVNASEISSHNSDVFPNYITVNYDEICLTDDGMFVYIDREYKPIYALYFNEACQYTYHLDFHERIHDIVTCPNCYTVYDRRKYKVCPVCPKGGRELH